MTEDKKPDAEAEKEKPAEKAFSQEQLDRIIKDRLTRAEAKITGEVEARLMVDDAFRSKALDAWDVKPAETQTLDDAKVRELHTAWETKHVEPLKTENTALLDKVGRLTRSQLEADILSAAASSPIQKALLAKQESGHSALFAMIEGNFVQDGEEWRVRGTGDDFRPSPDGERLYMDIPEYIKDWAANKANAVFVDDTTQEGANSDGDPAEGGKKVYSRAEYKKLCNDPDYYAKHRDELSAADREGRVKR